MRHRLNVCLFFLLASGVLVAQDRPRPSTPTTLSNLPGSYGDVILDGDACCGGTAGVLLRAGATKPSVVAQTGTGDSTSGFSVFNSAGSELFQVRSDGVIALGGVAASPWSSIVRQSIEYKNTSVSFGQVTDLHVTSNAYYSGTWKYRTSNKASNYYLVGGGHYWRVAPTGTADQSLAWVDAMMMDNTGNLGIGTPLGTTLDARLYVKGGTTPLRVGGQNANGYGFFVRDSLGITGLLGGVVAELTGNSQLRLPNLHIGDGTGQPDVTATGANRLYLNRASGTPVQVAGASSGGTATIVLGNGTANANIEMLLGDASAAYTTIDFLTETRARIGTIAGYKGYGVFIQGGGGSNASNTVIVSYDGNVGIGTLAPAAGMKLDVVGNANFSGTVSGGNIVAKYQDLAEWVPSENDLAPGTVVVLDARRANHVTSSSHAYDTAVAGVVSAQPGIALGEAGAEKELIATTGRVRVRVDAREPIAIGDLLVTSDKPGVAMKSIALDLQGIRLHRPGTVLGKALEPLERGEGEILVLLSLQ